MPNKTLRVSFKTTTPMFLYPGRTEHVFYVTSFKQTPLSVELHLGSGCICVPTRCIDGPIRIGPKEHPEHYGCKVCSKDMACTHLRHMRHLNNDLAKEFNQ